MFIPNYQIHNILKDFTHQLKNEKHRQDAGLRLETVVNKVAGTIVDRVTRLSEEEVQPPSGASDRPGRPLAPAPGTRPSGNFRYHTMSGGPAKTEHSLAVENPAQLIERFHSVMDETE
jgi:hypothetical protein